MKASTFSRPHIPFFFFSNYSYLKFLPSCFPFIILKICDLQAFLPKKLQSALQLRPCHYWTAWKNFLQSLPYSTSVYFKLAFLTAGSEYWLTFRFFLSTAIPRTLSADLFFSWSFSTSWFLCSWLFLPKHSIWPLSARQSQNFQLIIIWIGQVLV